jgi:hypothetical protein
MVLVALVSTNAIAADFPNVIGTWSVSTRRHAETAGPPAELASLSVKIIRQDGDSFSGTVIGLKGKTERIVGAFRRDRRTFVYTSDKTAGVGQVQGSEMQICRTDAGCAVLSRSK